MYLCLFVVNSLTNTFLSLCSVLLDILIHKRANLHVMCVPLGICVLYLMSCQSFVTLVNSLFLDR